MNEPLPTLEMYNLVVIDEVSQLEGWHSRWIERLFQVHSGACPGRFSGLLALATKHRQCNAFALICGGKLGSQGSDKP